MGILEYIEFHYTSEIVINQKNHWFCTIVITILDFIYIRYYKIVANTAHTELIISCQPL